MLLDRRRSLHHIDQAMRYLARNRCDECFWALDAAICAAGERAWRPMLREALEAIREDRLGDAALALIRGRQALLEVRDERPSQGTIPYQARQ